MAILVTLLLALLLAKCEGRSFAISQDSFLKDGVPFRILGGDMHYFRIVPQYWEDRLLRAKYMGLNTVQTYVPWNLHEASPNSFHFDGSANLEAFLQLAQQLDLLVMLRIGPYICAEWDFGGFPSWLLSIEPALRLRSSDPQYLQLVDNWWSILLPKLYPLLYSQGGPIIMVQIENEYGSYGNDSAYIQYLANRARDLLGDNVILYTTDGATEDALKRGTNVVANVYAAIDFPTGWDPAAAFALQKRYNLPGNSPALSAEFYTGWLTHWGEKAARTSARETAYQLDKLLATNGSVVLYMAHGGSNFGFSSGANTGSGAYDYQPDITSYDYDAPISEDGDLTEKYHHLRRVFLKHFASSTTVPPELPGRKAYGNIDLQKLTNLFDAVDVLSDAHQLLEPVAMELLNQTSGFILYVSEMPSYAKPGSVLYIEQVHDRAQIFMGTNRTTLRFIGTIERWSSSSLALPSGTRSGMQLWILVENMGRVNYGPFLYDRKGILSSVLVDDQAVINWVAYPLELQNDWSKLMTLRASFDELVTARSEPDNPSFYAGEFTVDAQADTFLSMRSWRKGVVFLNGFNLGRYWPSAGPQCTLYVPAPLLNRGKNQLVILELEYTGNATVEFVLHHDWTCHGNGAGRSSHNKYAKMA